MVVFVVIPQIVPFSFGEDTINTGDSTSLTCTVTKGDLPIEFSWLHNNNTVENDDYIAIFKTSKKISTLSFDSVQPYHIGQYSCVAQNSAGFSSYSTDLFVNGSFH